MSVFLEMKPRSELASLFIDIPPEFREKNRSNQPDNNEKKKIKYDNIDVVSLTEKRIRIGAPPSAQLLNKNQQEVPKAISINNKKGTEKISNDSYPKTSSNQSTPTKKVIGKKKAKNGDVKFIRFGGTLKYATMNVSTLCSPTWAENNPRLFMCKIQVEPDRLPLVSKTLHRIATDICKKESLNTFAEKGNPKLRCSKCSLQILSEEYIKTIGVLPDDNWFSTSQSVEFSCRDACGAACDPDRHNHSSKKEQGPSPEWLPHEKRIMISYVNTTAHASSVLIDNIKTCENIIYCGGCKSEIGIVLKNHSKLYCFNHVATTLTAGSKNTLFLQKSLFSTSIYMSQLITTCCESQGSLKLVIRSLDKIPHLLIWLLDSYIVVANGDLQGLKNEDDDGLILNPFPAIKLLYKVFTHTSVTSDPRANGEDTSVGIVDIPLSCCQLLVQMLLQSSLRLPPACRAVGQFFVGYLQIDDHI
ncbi:unnamed protein product [Caenorhabditis bovis]|uniref:E3 ubiquitin-protein ligase E3D n=1 Tax=Caenorhabditis bovis TaxID=2654633 RepID=A0A8S1EML4_9PELO|nr:unnamed protein product [Caenorhabditis bovis]